jgi:hypothetical protein
LGFEKYGQLALVAFEILRNRLAILPLFHEVYARGKVSVTPQRNESETWMDTRSKGESRTTRSYQ